MSAETLRKAATLMRERAEAAPDGPWLAGERCVWGKVPGFEVVTDGPDGKGGTTTDLAADHIASWHPAVALAVADWLDDMARLYEHGDNGGPLIWHHALTIARVYLGEQS